MHRKKGFTLIELLVVIAIIGILSSVVLASLNSAREKSRDAKRVSDIKQLQLALELFWDTNGEYAADLAALQTGGFIPNTPTDPVGSAAYSYALLNNTTSGATCTYGTGVCQAYHLGADLEGSGNTTLGADTDRCAAAGAGCDTTVYWTNALQGEDADGCAGTANRYCYDVTP